MHQVWLIAIWPLKHNEFRAAGETFLTFSIKWEGIQVITFKQRFNLRQILVHWTIEVLQHTSYLAPWGLKGCKRSLLSWYDSASECSVFFQGIVTLVWQTNVYWLPSRWLFLPLESPRGVTHEALFLKWAVSVIFWAPYRTKWLSLRQTLVTLVWPCCSNLLFCLVAIAWAVN